ncbi:MAG: hypothetical protein HGJ94_17725 [Desulfosarcina sp.]|nr:hypothetical protein [Desulfosarcina sp.]
MKSVVSFLQDCRLGKKQVCRNLTVFPVLFPGVIEPYYLTLELAIDSGLLVVTEVDASGNVNRLKLRNNAKQPILLVEGEELKGAKQNRIVNASFLIAGKTATTIPVSCVEEQRWHYDTQKFSSGKKVMHASLRREVQYCLRDNLSRGTGHRTDQSAIWTNIAEKSKRMNVQSPTMAMSYVFEQFEDKLSDYSDSFHLIEQQVGALFAIDGMMTGLECFACSDTFGRFFDKLINSYAMDAIESVDKAKDFPSVQPGKAKAFVESIKKAKGQRHPVVSVGATISFESRIAAGTALADGETVLHLSAFRKADGNSRSHVGFQRFSARREMTHAKTRRTQRRANQEKKR